jgi:chromosome partitioning protein
MGILAIVGRKGGSGKTTTAINLAGVLAERRRRVALVDLDPQASLTRVLLHGEQPAEGIGARVLNPALGLDGLALPTHMEGIDLLPGDRSIENAALSLAENPMGPLRLRKLLQPLLGYDTVLVDTPPHLGFALYSALLAADYAILPTALVQQDLDALQDTLDTRDELEDLGPARVSAIVPNATRPYRHDAAAIAALRAAWGDLIADPIPLSESIKIALNRALPVVAYDPKGPAAAAYRTLADRLPLPAGVPAYA